MYKESIKNNQVEQDNMEMSILDLNHARKNLYLKKKYLEEQFRKTISLQLKKELENHWIMES
jgi:hypothetical protein